MKTKQKTPKKQPIVIPEYTVGTKEQNFRDCFNAALSVTRGFTLSRDVRECVEKALRREKRIS